MLPVVSDAQGTLRMSSIVRKKCPEIGMPQLARTLLLNQSNQDTRGSAATQHSSVRNLPLVGMIAAQSRIGVAADSEKPLRQQCKAASCQLF